VHAADAGQPALVIDPGLSVEARERLARKIEQFFAPGRFRLRPKRPDLTAEDHAHHIQWYDLDPSCRELLLRAQRAIGSSLQSGIQVNSAAERIVEEPVLRQHEWEIAAALRTLTRRRAEHQASLREGEPGPATAAVLEGQQHALELALGSIKSRIAALERYAAALAAADAADRDMERALRVSSRNDSYLDLVARTAADKLAVAELADVTEQAAIPKKAYLESLHRVGLAAEVLILPADDAGESAGYPQEGEAGGR
jgi:hypothetical protein